MVTDDEPPIGVFIGMQPHFFSMKMMDSISCILSSARAVGEGMAGTCAISSSLIARLSFAKTSSRRSLTLVSYNSSKHVISGFPKLLILKADEVLAKDR